MSENTLIIEPKKGLLKLDLRELWKFRELLYFLVWRDIKVRYKQTFIGASWAIVQPFFTMVVFTIFFGRIAQIPSDNVPYPIFSYSGLILWTYFSSAVGNSSNSLVGSSNLISKVYFPRLIIPLSSAISAAVDYFIATSILVVMMFYYGVYPNYQIIYLPFILILTFLSATGFGLWLSALNVKYRDVRFVLPFFIQLLMFLTPVIYPVSFIPEKYKLLLYLNPVGGLISAHRSLVIGQEVDLLYLLSSVVISVFLIITGLVYFKKTESFFADII